MTRPSVRIASELATWPGVTTGPGRFGAVTYSYNGREIGHVHGDSHADLPFATALRHTLVAEGRAEPHHFLPQTGWVTARFAAPLGVEGVLDLFRLNYDLILRKKQPAPDLPPG